MLNASLTSTDGCTTTSIDVSKSLVCSATVSRVVFTANSVRGDSAGIEDASCTAEGASAAVKVIVEACSDAATD
jgi:hypothetical protein